MNVLESAAAINTMKEHRLKVLADLLHNEPLKNLHAVMTLEHQKRFGPSSSSITILAGTIGQMRNIEIDALVDVIPNDALSRLHTTTAHELKKRFEQSQHGEDPRGPHDNERITPEGRSDDPHKTQDTHEQPSPADAAIPDEEKPPKNSA